MNGGSRRGVTRAYVGGLIFATAIVAIALVVASWGFISLYSGRSPIETPGVAQAASPLILVIALVTLVWGLWLQSLALLRGRRTPPWAHVLVLAGAAYLIWCIGGLLIGLSIDETWLSPYAGVLAPIWALSALLCWGVLARRVYTDRPVPKWPWEKRGEEGPASGWNPRGDE